MKREHFFGAIRWVLGGIFVYAGTIKIYDPYSFAASIAGYRLIPEGATLPLAHVIPLIELSLGLFILFNLFLRYSLLLLSLLLLIFQTALFSLIIRNIYIDCGCFGNLIQINDFRLEIYIAIIRNFLLLTFSILLMRRKQADSKIASEVCGTSPN